MSDATTLKSFNSQIYITKYKKQNENIESDIIRFIKQHKGKSGIIYCLPQ
jgi:ATP-dependent DNA helicase RecQ